jgi:hypothetical protein
MLAKEVRCVKFHHEDITKMQERQGGHCDGALRFGAFRGTMEKAKKDHEGHEGAGVSLVHEVARRKESRR